MLNKQENTIFGYVQYALYRSLKKKKQSTYLLNKVLKKICKTKLAKISYYLAFFPLYLRIDFSELVHFCNTRLTSIAVFCIFRTGGVLYRWYIIAIHYDYL